MVKALPNTSFLPVPKSAPAGHTTAAAHLLWQVFPRYPCLEYKDYSGQSCPVRYTWTASFGCGLMFWQKWFNLTPQFVAYQFPGHLLHPPLVFYCIFLYLSGFVRCSKLCKPKDEKRAGRKEKKAIVRAKAEEPETEASESCEPTELPSAPSPELAPQSVKIDNQQLLEIAASRYHAKRRANGSDMLCEIEAAADNLKQRWEQAFQYYPDLLTDCDNRAAVAKVAQSLSSYLNEVEERTL